MNSETSFGQWPLSVIYRHWHQQQLALAAVLDYFQMTGLWPQHEYEFVWSPTLRKWMVIGRRVIER